MKYGVVLGCTVSFDAGSIYFPGHSDWHEVQKLATIFLKLLLLDNNKDDDNKDKILKLSRSRGLFEKSRWSWAQVKVQWTEQLVATQQQKTEEIKKQTEQIKVDMEENNKYTSKILPSKFSIILSGSGGCQQTKGGARDKDPRKHSRSWRPEERFADQQPDFGGNYCSMTGLLYFFRQ